MDLTATDLVVKLMDRHREKFVCIPECKTGGSWVAGKTPRIDLWCMAKSWSKPRTIAYEIKVSRSDFLNDDKWPSYLPFCSEFYFAAPWGLIDPSEVPEDAGLVVMSKNLTRFYTKKKAPVRNVQIPDSIFRYILMWRTEIKKESGQQSHLEYWKTWLDEKDERKKLGWNVSKKIREIVEERISKVENRNIHLERENEKLAEAKQILERLGVGTQTFRLEHSIKEAVAVANGAIPKRLTYQIEQAHACIEKAMKFVEQNKN